MTPPKLTAENAVFLDFDGTLVDLAPTPDGVLVPEDLPTILSRLNEQLDGAVALVSGRQLDDLFGFLPTVRLSAGGSHGMERRLADGRMVALNEEALGQAEEINRALREKFGAEEGIIVENKRWSPTIHYRNAQHLYEECLDFMKKATSSFTDWGVKEGKMVIEARYGGISKADAVAAFMQEEPFARRVPVFFGDDVTDEDGMRAAQDHGGYGIKVGDGESVAKYRFENPAEVLAYLRSITE